MTTPAKKPNTLLAAVNRAVSIEQARPFQPASLDQEPKSIAEPKTGEAGRRSSRIGTKLVAGHFDPKVARQLRLIAAEEDTTVQALLEEALNLLFLKKGKARISDLAKN